MILKEHILRMIMPHSAGWNSIYTTHTNRVIIGSVLSLLEIRGDMNMSGQPINIFVSEGCQVSCRGKSWHANLRSVPLRKGKSSPSGYHQAVMP
jgi:hypothetical protein